MAVERLGKHIESSWQKTCSVGGSRLTLRRFLHFGVRSDFILVGSIVSRSRSRSWSWSRGWRWLRRCGLRRAACWGNVRLHGLGLGRGGWGGRGSRLSRCRLSDGCCTRRLVRGRSSIGVLLLLGLLLGEEALEGLLHLVHGIRR
jgi:hypothetical protein